MLGILVTLLLAQAPLAGNALSVPAIGRGDDLLALPPGLRLLTESLRVPFGDDWGGEMRGSIEMDGRVSLGLFMKVWSEGVCDPHWCADRSIHMGADVRVRVTPRLDLNLGYEQGKGPAAGRGPMLRARWKF
ncbi:MAG: hypothetical protein ABUL67_01020 [Haliangium ochraceum]